MPVVQLTPPVAQYLYLKHRMIRRRAMLIADVKQRLAGLQAHLGVSGGSSSAPPLPPLPKYQARPPEQVLLTPKKKRNAVEDEEWEARTIEALLIRGVSRLQTWHNVLELWVLVVHLSE